MSFRPLVALTLAVCVFALSSFKALSHDIWIHMRSGQLIVEKGRVPATDEFSAPARGKRWVYHEWLFGLVAYLVWKVGGFRALVLAKALWLSLLALVLYGFSRRRGAGPCLAAALVLLGFLGARFRFILRPHLFMFMAVALSLYLLERARRGESRLLAWLPPLQLIWTNSHGSFILGPLMVLGAGLEVAWRERQKGWPSWRPWALALAAVAAATLVNPYGVKLLSLPARFAGMSVAKALIVEWRRPTPGDWLSIPGLLLLALLIVGVLLALAREVSLFEWALLALFAALAFEAIRFHALWSLVASALLAGWISTLMTRSAIPGKLERLRFPAATAFMLAATIWAVKTHPHFKPGLGLDEAYFPQGAVRLISALKVPGTVANPYNWGGYFIWNLWPERMVLLDGRAELYDEMLLHDLLVGRSVSALNSTFERYGVSILVTKSPPERWEELALQGSRWVLLLWDDLSQVWLKDTEEAREDLERYRLRVLPPLEEMSWDAVKRKGACQELERLVEASPLHFSAAYWLGRCRYLMGPAYHQAAAEAFRQALRVRADAGVKNDLGIVLKELGRRKEAERTFREALALDPDYAEAAYNLANLLWAEGRRQEARQAYRRFLEKARPEWEGARRLARQRIEE